MSEGVYVRIRLRCGKCGHQYTYDETPYRNAPSPRQMERDMRLDGWGKKGQHGWVCPECKSGEK